MEKDELKILSFDRICRLCLNEKRLLMDIFESEADTNNITIDQKIMSCANINLFKDDGLPPKICAKCFSKLNAAFEFKTQCENADKALHGTNNLVVVNETVPRNEVEENELGKKGKDGTQPEKVIGDLSHIIVIKKPDKETEKTEEKEIREPNQMCISNIEKQIGGEVQQVESMVFEDEAICNQGELALPSVSDTSSYPVEKPREARNTAGGISFVFEKGGRGKYKIVMKPLENVEADEADEDDEDDEADEADEDDEDDEDYEVDETDEADEADEDYEADEVDEADEDYEVDEVNEVNKVSKVNEVRPKEKKRRRGDSKKSPCPFCHKMLARVEEHVRLLHHNRVYVCTKTGCGAEFLTLKNLQSHQLLCFDMKKAYKCEICLKEFHRKSNFKAHVRRHGTKKEYQCQLCERAFVDSTGLRRHFLKHHEPEQETFVSGCCGKKFKSKEGLKKHIQNGTCGMNVF